MPRGGSPKGRKLSAATRAKMSVAAQHRWEREQERRIDERLLAKVAGRYKEDIVRD